MAYLSSWFRLRRAGALAGVLLALACARADDFDTLRLEWRDFITGGTNLNLADGNISSRVSGAASSANNSWNSMNKSVGRTYLWNDAASTTVSADITTCYSHLSAMAQGWATIGSSLYGNSSLAADIVSGLDWTYTNRYNESKSEYDNWWDWEIGVPMALNNCMVMMYPVLSGTQITNYCNAIDHFSPAVTLTAANRVWKAESVGVRGVVGRNAAKVAAARDGLSDVSGGGASSVFAYVTTGDGFYRDGSFIQHGKHPYTAGYGLSLFGDVARMLVWLDGTQWAVTDPQRTNVIRWCYDSYEPLIYFGAMPEHLRGREISRNYTGYGAGHHAVNTILRMAQTAPANDAARLKSMVKYWGQVDTTASVASYADIDLVPVAEQLMADASVTPRGELVGDYQFPSMDRVMHLRPGFGFGLSMFSSRIYNYECINSENWHGWFIAHGMTYLWNSVDLTQFTDSYWPTIDPYHLPGTTVDLTAVANGANQGKTSTQPWVGGVMLSNSFGAVGMALDDVNGSLVANKSWFMFDDEIVCLGAGITCSSATNVHTTIENRSLHMAVNNVFTVNGTAMPMTLGWSSNLNHITWCALDTSGGYYFPGGANLVAQRLARTGKWSNLNAGGSTTAITRNYLTLIWDHGISPVNSAYAYVLLPNKSASAVSQYAANPSIIILTNSPAVQAVRENSLGVLAANFWTDGAKTVDALTASTRAAVITRETNGVLEISLSDPTWTNTGTITVTYSRSANSLLSADPGVSVLQLTPAVQLAANVSGARGKTFQARFSVAPTIAAPVLLPIANQSIVAGTPWSVQSQASDPTSPTQRLAFGLLSAPAGAALDPATGLITWRPPLALAGTSNLFTLVVTQNGWLTNLAPLADAYVRDGSWANTNFGSETFLAVKASGPGLNRESFLKFDVSGLPGAASNASLQLTPTATSLPGTHAVAAVADNSWTESTLTWSNKPNSGPPLATWVPQLATPTQAPVVAAVQDALLNSGGLLTLRIFATNTTTDGLVQYRSKEGAAANAPRLSITSSTGISLSATQSFWVLLTLPQQPLLLGPVFSNNLMQFTASVSPGPQYTIQASTNLLDWTTLLVTNAQANSVLFVDPETTNYSSRFYRIIMGP